MGRSLTHGERTLAQDVFGGAVQVGPVRLHAGGFGGFACTLGRRVFFPESAASEDFAAADPHSQALFVHELVHVWQFQTRPLRTLMSWAGVVASGGYGPALQGYRYALPLGAFDRLNLEQQASVVEHAFLLSLGCRSGRMAGGLCAADLSTSPFPLRRGTRGPWG